MNSFNNKYITEHVIEKNYVFVSDEIGIQQSFSQVELELNKDLDQFITVLYLASRDHVIPCYTSELDSLERRFIYKLIVFNFYFDRSMPDDTMVCCKILDSFVNKDSSGMLHFIINGEKAFVDFVSSELNRIGVRRDSISTQVFQNQPC